MRIVLGAAGSRGDVVPILEIAALLRDRGHDTRVFVPRHFEGEATRRGLRASHFATDSKALMRSLDAGWRSAQQTLAWAQRAMLEQFDVLLPAAAGADALVTMINEIGAPTIAEYHRIPHFRVCCVPCLPGEQPPAVQPIQRLPAPLNRLLWEGVERGTMLIFGKALNAKRSSLGLSRVRCFSAYAAGYSRNLLAFDPILTPPGRGWRYPYEYVGYPFGGDDGPLPPEVEAFLAAGPRPVYLGFGSVCLPHPARTTRILLDAISQVGCRAILDRGWTGLGDGVDLPPDVLLLPDGAPHRRLFPRMAGLVHHGGSGTTHNAARAGVPQVIVPQMLDQYYWGARVASLGVGPRPVPQAALTTPKLVRLLRELLQPFYRHQAAVVADLMRTDGVCAIADAVERAFEPRRSTAPMAAAPPLLGPPWPRAEASGGALPTP